MSSTEPTASPTDDHAASAALYGPTYPQPDSPTWASATRRACVCGRPAAEPVPSRLEIGAHEPDVRVRYRRGDWTGACASHAEVVREATRLLNSMHD